MLRGSYALRRPFARPLGMYDQSQESDNVLPYPDTHCFSSLTVSQEISLTVSSSAESGHGKLTWAVTVQEQIEELVRATHYQTGNRNLHVLTEL